MSPPSLAREIAGADEGLVAREAAIGDRVVVPFTIVCGACDQCRRGNFSVCERTNRNRTLGDTVFGHSTAGLFGYTHLTGGYAGGQADYVRVPFADTTHIKVPDTGLTDTEQTRPGITADTR